MCIAGEPGTFSHVIWSELVFKNVCFTECHRIVNETREVLPCPMTPGAVLIHYFLDRILRASRIAPRINFRGFENPGGMPPTQLLNNHLYFIPLTIKTLA